MEPSRDEAVESSPDEVAFYEFFRRHRAWSRALMRRVLAGTGSDWEVHWLEAWTKFSRSYLNPTFAFTRDPEAYLRRILANQVIDALRQHAREGKPLLLGEQDESLEDLMVQDRAVSGIADGQGLTEMSPADWQDPLLAAAVARLSPMQRAVILLWAWMQPPPTDKEIGEEFGISDSTAKTHRIRALEALRRMLLIERLDSPGLGEETI